MKEKLEEQLNIAKQELNNANQQLQFWTHRSYALQGRVATLEELLNDEGNGKAETTTKTTGESEKKD